MKQCVSYDVPSNGSPRVLESPRIKLVNTGQDIRKPDLAHTLPLTLCLLVLSACNFAK